MIAVAFAKLIQNLQSQAVAVEGDEVVEVEGEFSIPAAPVLIPKGPWKEIDGCVCAPKGFKAQGRKSLMLQSSSVHTPPHAICKMLEFHIAMSFLF